MSLPYRKNVCWDVSKGQVERQLLTFTFPQRIQHDYYFKRKYRITLKFICKDGKQRFKTIYFGVRGFQYRVEGGQKIRFNKQTNDYFHPTFWEDKLLNQQDSIDEAFIRLTKLILKNPISIRQQKNLIIKKK